MPLGTSSHTRGEKDNDHSNKEKYGTDRDECAIWVAGAYQDGTRRDLGKILGLYVEHGITRAEARLNCDCYVGHAIIWSDDAEHLG